MELIRTANDIVDNFSIFPAVFGQLANLIPHVYTYYISTALFAIFGLKMLRDGYYMSPSDSQEELEEVQSDLKKREDEVYINEYTIFFLFNFRSFRFIPHFQMK